MIAYSLNLLRTEQEIDFHSLDSTVPSKKLSNQSAAKWSERRPVHYKTEVLKLGPTASKGFVDKVQGAREGPIETLVQ